MNEIDLAKKLCEIAGENPDELIPGALTSDGYSIVFDECEETIKNEDGSFTYKKTKVYHWRFYINESKEIIDIFKNSLT